MDTHLDRAGVLLQQGRYAMAEQELRARLVQQPEDPVAHALLALCLSYQDKHEAASAEAGQAIHYGPDHAFPHYAMGTVLLRRNRFAEAEASAREAIRLDPYDADHFSLLASIHLAQRRWRQALDASTQGLELDPEHAQCKNLHAMALVKLGRKAEAGIALEGALARDPDNALSHANQGWALLHAGRHQDALGHFREALRLNPEMEWARQGIVEALKARHVAYGLMLRYFLWMSRLSARAQWLVVIGAWLAYKAVTELLTSRPELGPIALPVMVLYLVFVVLTWTADALFNLLLRLDRFGRLVLSEEETFASNCLGACLGAALLSGLVWIGTSNPAAGTAAIIFGVLSLPVSATFRCHLGWPRNAMAVYTGFLGVLGASALALQLGSSSPGSGNGLASTLSGLFFLGSAFSLLVANVLMSKQPTK